MWPSLHQIRNLAVPSRYTYTLSHTRAHILQANAEGSILPGAIPESFRVNSYSLPERLRGLSVVETAESFSKDLGP